MAATNKIRYNKSKTYLLPLISELINLEPKFFDYLINTYIFDSENKYTNCIFIEHKFNFKNPEFTAYEHRMIDNQYFIDLIDIDDRVVYIFKFPEEYMLEYNHFINGNYSKFQDDAKDLILEFYGKMYENNLNALPFLIKVKQILFKDEKLRKKLEEELKVEISKDAELSDIALKSDETIKLPIKEKAHNIK